MQASNSGVLEFSTYPINNFGGNIQATSGATVQFDGSVIVQGGTLTNNGGTMQTGGLVTGYSFSATLDGKNQGALTINGTYTGTSGSQTYVLGTINNTGNLQINGGGGYNTLLYLSGNTTLTGEGTVTLNSASGSGYAYLQSNGPAYTLTNTDNTIQGSGALGNGTALSLVNQVGGVIDAISMGTPQSTVLLVHAQGGTTNQGLMQASNSGVLQFSSYTINNFGGTIQANSGATVVFDSSVIVQGGTLYNNGGTMQTGSGYSATLDGKNQGALTIVGTYTGAGNNTQTTLLGTINNTGNLQINGGGGTNTYLYVGGDTTLTGGGTVTLNTASGGGYAYLQGPAGYTLTNTNNTIQGAGIFGNGSGLNVANAGLITANVTGQTLNMNTGSGATIMNSGTLQAANGGTLNFSNGNSLTNQGGVIEALANSTVVLQSNEIVTNLASNTLTGGTWRANSVGGSSALIDFQGTNTIITTNSANIYLIGANSVIQGRNSGGTVQTLDHTLSANTSSGDLFLQGRTFNATANSGNFLNNGVISLNGGTFLSNTLVNNYYVLSDGNSTVTTTSQMTGTGWIAASGTLTITSGVNMGGTNLSEIEINQGGTIDLHNATAASAIGNIFMNTSSHLNLGTQNINVYKDYTNDNFGTGNSFNRRANVTGTGQIIGVNASQTIVGDVSGTTPTFTMNFGNQRGGNTTPLSYSIYNNGGGADIYGAIQTNSVNGGNITDNRLTGSGVTAGNFQYPIPAGSNSYSNYVVYFHANSGGALTGQSVAVVSNFDNVTTQVINFTGAASALAVGNATPNTNPVSLGNFHVNGTQPTQAFAVANTTPANGIYTERLGIGSVGTTGNFSASNNLGSGFIAGGDSLPNAVSAQVHNGVAGVNSGSVAIHYTTNGQLLDSTFTTINANSQTINLQATGYNLAQATINNPSDFNLGNILLSGGPVTRTLSLSNSQTAGSFTEALNASFNTVTNNGVGTIGTSGSITGLLAGAGPNTTMQVTYTPTTQGSINASIQLQLYSNGTAIGNGLGITQLPDQFLSLLGTVTGTVGALAQAGPATPNPINFGNVRVNAVVPSQTLSIQNIATGPAEGLNASIATSTPGLTASGSFTGLAPQATNTSLSVGMITTTAGSRNGTATITLVSDGTYNSGVTTPLGTQTVNVTGGVYRLATGNATPTPLQLGNFRLATPTATGNLAVTNTAANDGFSEQLGIQSVSPSSSLFTATNSLGSNRVNAGASASNAITVGLGTGLVAGLNSGSVNIQYLSDGTATNSGAPINNNLQNVAVNAYGYRLANPTNTPSVTLAARVGDSAPSANISITNSSPDVYTEGLKVTRGSTAAGFNSSGSITNLAAQGNSTAIQVTLNTGTAGTFSGNQVLNYVSTGAGTTGATDYSLGTQNVTLNGRVYTPAVASLTGTVNFGIVHLGDSPASQQLTVQNTAAFALNDVLRGTLAVNGPFTGGGSINSPGLSAGATQNFAIGLNTSSAGLYNSNATFSGVSHNADMSDLTLVPINVGVSGQVNNYALAELLKGNGGAGTFSQSGSTYTLDFGTQYQNSGTFNATLFAENGASGLADWLRGNFSFLDSLDFGENGFVDFSKLAAGDKTGPLTLAFDTTNLVTGTYTDVIKLYSTGYNDNPFSKALDPITLTITGQVVQQGSTVPEPATMLLLGTGLIGLLGLRRKMKK